MSGYLGDSGFNAPQNSNTNQTPGAMGSSTYQVQNYNIDPNAFTNPLSTNQTAGGFTNAQSQLLGAAGAQAPTIGPAATSQGAGNAGQLAVANQELGIANGTGPNLAGAVAAQQGQQAQAANLSAMGSARGSMNPALANYQLGVNNAGVQNQVAQNAVTGQLQQQQNALGAAGAAYGGVTQNQQFNAQQIQQNAIQQATLQAQQMGLQGQELQNYINNNAQQIANTMTAAQSGQQLGVSQNLGLNQIQSTAYNNAAGHSLGADVTNVAGTALGALAKASDIRLKKNIKPGKVLIDKFLSGVR